MHKGLKKLLLLLVTALEAAVAQEVASATDERFLTTSDMLLYMEVTPTVVFSETVVMTQK